MRFKTISLALALALAGVGAAQAQGFGGLAGKLPGIPGRSAAPAGDVDAQVAAFNEDATEIRAAVFFSVEQILAAVGTKEQIAKVRVNLDASNKVTNPKELGSLQGAVLKTEMQQAQEALNAKDATEKLEKMSPEMRAKVGKSMLALGIAALRMPNTIKTGQGIVQGAAANPMSIPKVIPVKDGLAMFADILPKLPTLVQAGFKMMRDVKMDPGNPSADAKPVVDNNISFPA